jgi:hypothetical protein
MAQIRTAQAIVANASQRVIASDAIVDWSTVNPNDIFSVPAALNSAAYNNGVLYFVDHTAAPGVSGSGKWEIFLSVPFSKPSGTVYYAVSKDFFPNTGAPKVNYGDVETILLLMRAVAVMDGYIGRLVGTTHSKVIAGADIGAIRIYMPITGLTVAPTFVGRPVFKKTASGEDDIDPISIDTVTSAGYYVNLSAGAVAGQTLQNSYVPNIT